MGHEKHTVLLVGFFFTKVTILTKFEIVHLVKKDIIFKMIHQDAHDLVKLAILIS
jgi:hypothetical protein